jgi:predicted nucleotidyltransferase
MVKWQSKRSETGRNCGLNHGFSKMAKVQYNIDMTDLTQRTALELPVDEWKTYRPVQAILKRQAVNQAQLDLRYKRAVRLARQVATLLRKDFSARRVALFGSLASRSNFTLWSDIDLAAWGITAEHFYAAVAAVTGLSAEFKIDLVDAEACKASLRSAIDREGIDL